MKDETAEKIARGMGLNTLEMFVKPHAPFQPFIKGAAGFKASQTFWDNASKAFAEFASGHVHVLFSPKRDAEIMKGDKSSVWAKLEGPSLMTKFRFAAHGAKNAVKGMLGQKTPQGPNAAVSTLTKVIVDDKGAVMRKKDIQKIGE